MTHLKTVWNYLNILNGRGKMAENGISNLVLLFKKTFKIDIKHTVEDKRIKEMRY